MEYSTSTLLIFTIIIIIIIIIIFPKLLSKSKLPPGPIPWPIIGNIHKLGNKPHRAVAELVKKYGPIITLKLGSVTAIVISSPEIAQEMFHEHDLVLSGRCNIDAMRAADHEKYSLVFQPICPRWRALRKIATIQLFTSQRLDATQVIRQKKVNELVEYVTQCSERGQPVEIGKAVFTTTLNLLSNTIFSLDLASHDSSNLQEFRDLIWGVMEEVGRPNISDFFPLVRGLDLQGVFKRTTGYANKLIRIFDDINDTRVRDLDMVAKDDVLSILLKLVEDDELSLDEAKHLLVDLFVAGTDTSSSTLEWAMTELLCNPQKMEKAQIEVDKVLLKEGSMQESNITKLPYLQAILKETLRLHPTGPFLVPHKAEKDVELCNYLVPKNSAIWINVWSIGRSPSVWPNPELFNPERFMEIDIDFRGRDFELIPFGSGRRICPGMPLAYRMTHLMLATLIHSFNWKCECGISPKDISMEEKFGLTLKKVEPLRAIPILR